MFSPKWSCLFGVFSLADAFWGHQQVGDNKVLSNMPYYHLLPIPIYKSILKVANENPSGIEDLVEVKETGISIEPFERILSTENYETLTIHPYLINPIYKYKFNPKPTQQLNITSRIPRVRNFLTTAMYYARGSTLTYPTL